MSTETTSTENIIRKLDKENSQLKKQLAYLREANTVLKTKMQQRYKTHLKLNKKLALHFTRAERSDNERQFLYQEIRSLVSPEKLEEFHQKLTEFREQNYASPLRNILKEMKGVKTNESNKIPQ